MKKTPCLMPSLKTLVAHSANYLQNGLASFGWKLFTIATMLSTVGLVLKNNQMIFAKRVLSASLWSAMDGAKAEPAEKKHSTSKIAAMSTIAT